MEELKPCPFCGAQVKLMAVAGEPYPPTYEVNLGTVSEDSDDICYVHCPTCGANWHIEVRVDAFPMDTIAAWNRRPSPENKPLTIDQLNQMDGETVWVVTKGKCYQRTVTHSDSGMMHLCTVAGRLSTLNESNHGRLWTAYAERPEQEEKF